ncbi:alpha/beta hydrolase [Amycolatopsis sp. K13G38]|uniref:Alpha/beta hydrolase n=1 Tax=Amycolatopsis acididurans TaxID=2724524 RepID=A0ABX1IVF6_9PSEU|nr:alpha/beta hydrolase [Amycolatopsis acididurans]NKQ51441.1 alpha/beta hydrolase [Amycolatopsis acididurans]
MEHLRVEANGIEFHVAADGPVGAPPILFLHGFPEGSAGWYATMRLLPDHRVYAPDLRGYPGTDRPRGGYDVFTLTDDIKALIAALGLRRPPLVTHDWGGALGWIFAHRFSALISHLVVVNCTHPRTLVRAALTFDRLQPLRIPWVLPFQVPWLPEFLLTTPLGRIGLRLSFVLREGSRGHMDTGVVDDLVDGFRSPADLGPPIDYYRAFVATLVFPRRRARLYSVYDTPITVPVTLIWGLEDEALPAPIAEKSARDAGHEVEWRPLPGIGHFVDLEAPGLLAAEITRALAPVRA